MNDQRGFAPTPPWMEYLGVDTHWTRVCQSVGQKHQSVHWRSHEAKHKFMQSKYLPHQGKKECARRANK